MPKKFTFWRNAVIAETYEVVAESAEEAREQLMNGVHDPVNTEWMDWSSDHFELEFTEELDPLYCMIKDYNKLVDN